MMRKSSAWRKPISNSSLDIFGQPKKGGGGEPIRNPQGSVVTSLSGALNEPNELYSNFKQSNADPSELQQLLAQLSLSNNGNNDNINSDHLQQNQNEALPPHLRNSINLFGPAETEEIKPIASMPQNSESGESSLRKEALLKKKAYLEYRSILDRQIAEKQLAKQKQKMEKIETEKSELQKIAMERKALETKYKYELMAEKHAPINGGGSDDIPFQVYAPPPPKKPPQQKVVLSPQKPYNVEYKETESDHLSEQSKSSDIDSVLAYLLDKKRDTVNSTSHNSSGTADNNYSDIIQLLGRNKGSNNISNGGTSLTLPPIKEEPPTQTIRNSVFYESAVSLLKSHFEEEQKKWSVRFDQQEQEMSKLRAQINEQQSKQHSTLDQLLELQSELSNQISHTYPSSQQRQQLPSSLSQPTIPNRQTLPQQMSSSSLPQYSNGDRQFLPQYSNGNRRPLPQQLSSSLSNVNSQRRHISPLATAAQNQFFNPSSVSSSVSAPSMNTPSAATHAPTGAPPFSGAQHQNPIQSRVAPTDIPIRSKYILEQQQKQSRMTTSEDTQNNSAPISARSQIRNNSYFQPHISHLPWEQQQQQSGMRNKWMNGRAQPSSQRTIDDTAQSIPITRAVSPIHETITQITKPDSQMNSPQNGSSDCDDDEAIQSDHKTESSDKPMNDTDNDDDNDDNAESELCLRSESVFVECVDADFSDDDAMIDLSQLSKSSIDDNDADNDANNDDSNIEDISQQQNGAKKTLFHSELSALQSLKNSTQFQPTSMAETAADTANCSTADDQDYSSYSEEFGMIEQTEQQVETVPSRTVRDEVHTTHKKTVSSSMASVQQQLQQSYDLMVLGTDADDDDSSIDDDDEMDDTVVGASIDGQLIHPNARNTHHPTVSQTQEHEIEDEDHDDADGNDADEEEEENMIADEDSQEFSVHVVMEKDQSPSPPHREQVEANDDNQENQLVSMQSQWKSLNEIDRQSISSLRSAFASIDCNVPSAQQKTYLSSNVSPSEQMYHRSTVVPMEKENNTDMDDSSDESGPESPPQSNDNSGNESENESNDEVTTSLMTDSVFSSFQSESQSHPTTVNNDKKESLIQSSMFNALKKRSFQQSYDIISEPLSDIDCRSTVEFNADDFPLLNVGTTSFITVSNQTKQHDRRRPNNTVKRMANATEKMENEIESNGYYSSSFDDVDDNDDNNDGCDSDIQYSDMLCG